MTMGTQPAAPRANPIGQQRWAPVLATDRTVLPSASLAAQ